MRLCATLMFLYLFISYVLLPSQPAGYSMVVNVVRGPIVAMKIMFWCPYQ